ncbi:MAG: carboxyl transferase domain-containing protein, partial [Dietzia maris]
EGPKLRKQLIDMYNEFIATPYTAAERGYIDAVIEPSQTRLVLRGALNQLRDKISNEPPRKHPIAPM